MVGSLWIGSWDPEPWGSVPSNHHIEDHSKRFPAFIKTIKSKTKICRDLLIFRPISKCFSRYLPDTNIIKIQSSPYRYQYRSGISMGIGQIYGLKLIYWSNPRVIISWTCLKRILIGIISHFCRPTVYLSLHSEICDNIKLS